MSDGTGPRSGDSAPRYDEIDLREYVDLLWRSRWVVAALTLGAALAAFALSRFVLPPVYEAGALLVAESPPARRQALVESTPEPLVELVEAVSRPSWLSPESYRDLADSEEFKHQLTERLVADGVAPESGWRLRPELVRGSNLLRLRVEAADPEMAAKVSNAAAQQLLQRVLGLNQQRLSRVVAFIEEQLADARRSLEQATQELQALSRQSPSVQELQQEVDVKLGLLSQYKSKAVELEVAQQRDRAILASLEAAIRGEPATVTVRKGLSPEAAVLEQVARSAGIRPEGPVLIVDDQQLNPVRAELETQAVRLRAELEGMAAEERRIRQQIEGLSAELKQLQAQLVEQKSRRDELTLRVDMARRNYELLVSQHQAQRAAAAARIGETMLTLAAPAVPPREPSRPNALLNAAVAGLLGFMVGVFGVFFAEFLRQPVPDRRVAAAAQAGAVGGAAR